MSVDLEAYKSAMGSALRSQGYACVFVATTTEGKPCRLNYATDLLGAVKRLRRTSPAQLVIEEVVWLPDRSMAMMVAEHVRDALEGHLTAGGWLNLPAAEAAQAVRSATGRHPGAVTFTHAQLVSRWTSNVERHVGERGGARTRIRQRLNKKARQAAKALEPMTT